MKRVEALKKAISVTDQPAKPREWIITCGIGLRERPGSPPGNYHMAAVQSGPIPRLTEEIPVIEKPAYDAMVNRCEKAEEGERFYRREWESACERANYANEECGRMAKVLADLKRMHVCEFEEALAKLRGGGAES
jgi:hypothetical protein